MIKLKKNKTQCVIIPILIMKIPSDTKSERQIISLIVQNPEAIHQLSSVLPEHFYDLNHKNVYRAAVNVQGRGEVVDMVSVENELGNIVTGSQKDGAVESMLSSLEQYTTMSSLPISMDNVVNSYRKRKLQELIEHVSTQLNGDDSESSNIDTIVEDINRQVIEIQSEGAGRKKCDIVDLAEDYVQYLKDNREKIENSDGNIIGLPTGIDELDVMIDGLQNSSLYVVAAMTSGGKSAHMINMVSAITNIGKKASVYSLEMTPNGIINRIIGLRTELDASKIKRLELDSEERHGLTSEINNLKEQWLRIYDSEFSDIDRIVTSIVSDVYCGKTDVAFIDYIQMVSHKDSKEERHKLEYAVTALRAMVNRIGIPVVVLTQLNNETVDNPNKESHGFQGSGAIAQRATAAWTLKPEVSKSVRKEMHKEGMPLPIKIEFNKNQEGAVSYCLASFIGKTGKFKSVDRKEFDRLRKEGEDLQFGGFDFDDE